jgi:repressor LexA
LLDFIQDTAGREGRMPSYREMAKALGVSAVGTVQDLVRGLSDKGYVALEKSSSGKSRLSLGGHRHSPMLTIPIVGEVAAGGLQDAFEVALGSLTLSRDLLDSRSAKSKFEKHYFALRVKGESMKDAGILPGDFVVVEKGSSVKSGDFVVAEYQGEATLKEIEMPLKSGRPIRLIPHNETLSPIEISPDALDFRVAGRIVAVQRTYSRS